MNWEEAFKLDEATKKKYPGLVTNKDRLLMTGEDREKAMAKWKDAFSSDGFTTSGSGTTGSTMGASAFEAPKRFVELMMVKPVGVTQVAWTLDLRPKTFGGKSVEATNKQIDNALRSLEGSCPLAIRYVATDLGVGISSYVAQRGAHKLYALVVRLSNENEPERHFIDFLGQGINIPNLCETISTDELELVCGAVNKWEVRLLEEAAVKKAGVTEPSPSYVEFEDVQDKDQVGSW